MSLNKAHEGYEYQDLLSVYFILQEILQENESQFTIDRKEFADDKLDDLLITKSAGKFKKQIKYSDADTNHTFVKANISADSSYSLSLDSLYDGWLNHPEKETTEFRLCLAWNEPIDDLKNFLRQVHGYQTFADYPTKTFQIDGALIWPADQPPISSWRQFKKSANKINRDLFLEFCGQFLIEVGLPKISLDLTSPGALEKLVLKQVQKIGIGIFPNNHTSPENFILSLLAIVKRARSKSIIITIPNIFHELNINVEYGKIEQRFPVIEQENLQRKQSLTGFLEQAHDHQKIILLGEPGSGKSWFVSNLQKQLVKDGVTVIRHFCYTKLDDVLQRERIKVNIFYGNLIYDIIQAFPKLKAAKREKYASNLNELNILLGKIDTPTYLIVDGLDHIDRIFNFRDIRDISKADIAIIDSLQHLNVSLQVKIIIVSQNIPDLEKFTEFKKILVPAWTEDDIKALLRKLSVTDIQVNNEISLSRFLLEKSNGNPLYIKYIIEEIGRNPDNLLKLPAYSFNLKEYYDYLISQLNTREDVPQVLSGVSFSLTKAELEEITASGDHVQESIKVLLPVLRLNLSQNGYLIYHESFRRFIIEQLTEKSVSVEKKVFDPVKHWFETKDFFSFRKSFRYSLPFFYESGEFKKVLAHLKYDFVTQSVINGQQWELIKINYTYLVKVACILKDFPSIVLLNEIGKIISSTPNDFEGIFALYIETYGKIHGFSNVSEYLINDGEPTCSFTEGLRICYVCDQNGVAAPWDTYMEYFKGNKEIEKEIFDTYIKGLLVLKNEIKLDGIATKIIKNNYEELFFIYREEFLKYSNEEFTTYLTDKYENIKKIVIAEKAPKNASRDDIVLMSDNILSFDNVFTKEANVLVDFFSAIAEHTHDEILFAEIISKFKGRNWFYNWLVYYLKIIFIKRNANFSYHQVKEAFDYLQYITEPFLGKPRTCDLYSTQELIYRSFQDGLELINSLDEWKEILDILVKVSTDTTTSLQKSMSGPLTTMALTKLMGEFANDINRDYINETIEEVLKKKEEYHLHIDIAEYFLRLSQLFYNAKNNEKATTYFNKAIEYSLAYTFHKDLTLHDVIEGIESYARIDPQKGLEDLKKAKVLIESAVEHTDGKETRHFPILWFEKFLKIDLHKASLFLLKELTDYKYNWRAEKSLIELLCLADSKIDPIIEFYLAITFPENDSEKFVSYSLNLHDVLLTLNPLLAQNLMSRIIYSVKPRQNRNFSKELIERINFKLGAYGQELLPVKQERLKEDEIEDTDQSENAMEEIDISKMTTVQLTEHFLNNDIKKKNIPHLKVFLNKSDELNEDLKQLIQIIVKKNTKGYPFDDGTSIDSIFVNNNNTDCYFWVCRYFYEQGGWFESFVKPQLFLKASSIDFTKAHDFLLELIPARLNMSFNYDFSANLIKTFADESYDKQIIASAWSNLLEITSYRLPSQEKIEWEEILKDDLDMDLEEVLICMIIARFRAETTERYSWGVSALKWFFENKIDRLLKPLKWFFIQRSNFLDSVLCIILQFLLEQKVKGSSFHSNFINELDNIFPRHHFLVDYLITNLLGKELPELVLPPGLAYPDIDKDEYSFFSMRNRRFRIIEECGINLAPVFSKFMPTFRTKYRNDFERYYNRVYKIAVDHVHSGELLFELLNKDLYSELKFWSEAEEKVIFEYATFIDIESMSTQTNCLTLRPVDLIKPYEFENAYTIINNISTEEWIRIGHYELALKDERALKFGEFKSFGGIVFADSETDPKIFPYSSFTIFPFHILGEVVPDFSLEKTVIFPMLQKDLLEYYDILWLNPTLLRKLGITTKNTHAGLVATDNFNEIVLRMRTWRCDYLVDSYRTSLSDQIPKFHGTDLIIRKDYFEKLCQFFQEKPSYRIVIIQAPDISSLEDD